MLNILHNKNEFTDLCLKREFFEPDKIRDGESLKKLEEIGGLEGLAKSLDTNIKVCKDKSIIFP